MVATPHPCTLISPLTPSRVQYAELPHTHGSLQVLLGGAMAVVIECDRGARLLWHLANIQLAAPTGLGIMGPW
jgi:hypothetical protein